LLRLKRVEIQGFKSFADRTEMKFHGSGIAAIVGPNGCGKSNLSDAINWVLGEQSAKSLRGARMEDVIFAGTRDRKALGLAAVTLTMVDPNFHEAKPVEIVHVDAPVPAAIGDTAISDTAISDAAPNAETAEAAPVLEKTAGEVEDSVVERIKKGKAREVTVTRRLYRNGDSEYLVDGKLARLRDIQDVFMGTGLGPESYAIIEQGRIGQILSTKPADRRAVIEEAAGITKFKTRRRLAEAKLESAKQNLNRVFDILEEVNRQVNSLKRQAAKAQRYEELRTELVTSLRLMLSGKYRLLERDAAKSVIDLNVASQELAQINEELTTRESAETEIYEQALETESRLTEMRQQLTALQIDAERTRGRLHAQRQQSEQMEQRLNQGEGEIASLEERLAAMALEIAAKVATVAMLATDAEAGRARLAEKAADREDLQSQVIERERAMESSRQLVLRMLGECSGLKNQLGQIDTYLAAMQRDSERLLRDEQAAVSELERLDKIKSDISERMSARQMQLESLADQRKEIESQLSISKAESTESRKLLEELREETSRLKARKDSLEEILSHRAYTTDSVKRLFTAIDKGATQEFKPLGVLADFVEVDAAFEKATEEFLHEELEYVVVKSWDEAKGGIDFMRHDLDGRATFLVHPEPGTDLTRGRVLEPSVGPDTGIVARLSNVLKLTNGLTHAPAELLPRLSRCFLTEDRESAQRLALQYPDVYFLLPDGVCFHGYAVSGGKKTSSGPLALKRELRELQTLTAQRGRDLMETEVRAKRLDQRIGALSEQLETLRSVQNREEKEALELGLEHKRLAEEHAKSSQRLSVARLDLERLKHENNNSTSRKAQLEAEHAAKDEQRVEMEESLAASREEITSLQAQLRMTAEEHAALRAELASLEERHRGAEASRLQFESQVREFGARKQSLSGEMERLGVDRARLLEDNIGLDARAEEFTTRIADLDAMVREWAATEQVQRRELEAISEALKSLRAAAGEAQTRRQQVELELVKKQSDLKHLEDTCRKELQTTLEELTASMETEPDEIQQLEAEEKYLDLRGRIDAMGPVNPAALEEYNEAQQRYDFLNTQRQDLLDSIRDTEKTIGEIDVESKRRFHEAFEAINANFRIMFGVLFNGGHGEMRLTDLENSTDSGIDIVAQPPGKKLQNVLLMSGGERAMTAMALLMAVFKYQPSPFCILDEVDAPLDEPNIIRLTKLLKEMSEHTQFIVITHAKRTMEIAQVLYGVTMQEPGVSKLVSVKFNPPPNAAVPPVVAATPVGAAAN